METTDEEGQPRNWSRGAGRHVYLRSDYKRDSAGEGRKRYGDYGRAREVFLQHQGADVGGTCTAQGLGRENGRGADGRRGDRQGLRVSVQPGQNLTRRSSAVGRDGKQVLLVLRLPH